ncbi:MAG: hypothetical protein JST58_02655 [Bacteroidetes bacterium]|nr:hypothetical protein [Bacteroidota bacterium]
MKKSITTLFLSILISAGAFGQKDYDLYIQALINGNFQLAKQIEKNNITTEPIEPKQFSIRNDPEHIFNIGLEKIKDSIASLFNFENQYKNEILKPVFTFYTWDEDSSEKHEMPIFFKAETTKDSIFSKCYFRNTNTKNDIYLFTMGNSWPSKLYFSKGKPLDYTTSFIIKLSAQSPSSTKVTIVAEEPIVFNGIKGFGVHAPIARETKVNSSTIEEYTLLLFIADKLGDKSLLPLLLPKDN